MEPPGTKGADASYSNLARECVRQFLCDTQVKQRLWGFGGSREKAEPARRPLPSPAGEGG
jgi:hypothetical protein